MIIDEILVVTDIGGIKRWTKCGKSHGLQGLVVDGMASDGETENMVDECQNTNVENNQARD